MKGYTIVLIWGETEGAETCGGEREIPVYGTVSWNNKLNKQKRRNVHKRRPNAF